MIFFFQHKISIPWSICQNEQTVSYNVEWCFNYNMWNVVVIHGIVTLSFFPS